jgi:hypothetical protein
MHPHFPAQLSPTEAHAIHNQIESLLRAHIAQPFRILREAGVVAELRSLLLADPAFSRTIPARVSTRNGKSPLPVRTVQVASVQLEITALPVPGQEPAGQPKTLDIAVLNSGCALICASGGPGDVIQQVPSEGLTAAIEVKASPSNDLSAGGAYARDIEALLRLARFSDVMGYFVLLDKSSALYGATGITVSASSQEASPRWMQDRPDAFLHEPHAKRGSRKRFFGSLKQKNITVSNNHPTLGTPHVEIWTIEWDMATASWQPVRRFAY